MSADLTERLTADPGPQRAPTLFEVVEQLRAVLQKIDDADGEVSDEDAAVLDALNAGLDQKAEAYHVVAVEALAQAEACKRMAAPYLERAKQHANRAERLKSRLFDALQLAGRSSAGGPTGGARLQLSPESVELLEGAKVPQDYLVVTAEPALAAIKAALKDGEKLGFARLVQNQHLRWR